MATAKKGKKTSKPKKSSKGKKKSGNSNFFVKFMLILLVLAMIVAAVFLTLNNFNINKNDKSLIKKETVIKKEDNRNVSKPATKPAETKKDDSKKETVKKEKAETKKDTKKEKNKESQRLTNLSGCWLSSEQGAFITLDQYGYRIDFSNVDASKPLTGNYYVENNLIVFTTDGNECKGTEGTYRITFYKKNFSLICKDDDCTSRRNILEADWEWVEF